MFSRLHLSQRAIFWSGVLVTLVFAGIAVACYAILIGRGHHAMKALQAGASLSPTGVSQLVVTAIGGVSSTIISLITAILTPILARFGVSAKTTVTFVTATAELTQLKLISDQYAKTTDPASRARLRELAQLDMTALMDALFPPDGAQTVLKI